MVSSGLDVTLHKISLQRARLLAAPPNERALFFLLGALGNDFGRLIDETNHCVRDMNAFIQNFMIAFIERYDVVEAGFRPGQPLLFPNAPRLDRVQLPAVVDASGVSNADDTE